MTQINIDRYSERDAITARGIARDKTGKSGVFCVKVRLYTNPLLRLLDRWYWTDERMRRLWRERLESRNA